MELYELTIKQAHEKLAQKEISAEELTRAFLARIDKLDAEIGAYLTVTYEEALRRAKEVDHKFSEGGALPILGGIPCAVKDVIMVEGVRCTAGSKILENYTAPYDASVVKKLKEERAVFLGKTNCDEFAMGASGENSAYFPTRNPRDLERVPGGSSSGSAAAVASDMAVYALGSDTGGSVRQPAGFTGIVGLRPTYGAVSRYGLIAMTSSMDQVGPMTKTVEDAQIVFNAIKGKDPLDSTSVTQQISKPIFNISGLKVGIIKEYFGAGLDPEVKKSVEKAVAFFEENGAKIQEVEFPHADYSLAAYYIIVPSEVSSNLARYDGIKYGASAAISNQQSAISSLMDVYFETRGKLLGTEARRRVMLGTYTLSAGYYDAYYLQAQKVRTLIREDFKKIFEKVDIVITPVSPSVAFRFGEKTGDPLAMYLEDIYMVPVNLAGVPALSLPCGEAHNLPVGMQLIGNYFQEELLFETGKWFQSNHRT